MNSIVIREGKIKARLLQKRLNVFLILYIFLPLPPKMTIVIMSHVGSTAVLKHFKMIYINKKIFNKFVFNFFVINSRNSPVIKRKSLKIPATVG